MVIELEASSLPPLTERRRSNQLWQQIVTRVTDLIHSGAWPHGALLPTQRTIADHFGVHVETVQMAMDHLATEGLIVNRSRFGRMVDNPPKEGNTP